MLGNTALYVALRAAAVAIRVFPLRMMYGIASCGGIVAYVVVSPARRTMHSNLSQVLALPTGSAVVRRTARRAFQNHAKDWIDTLRIGTLAPGAILDLVKFDGWENIVLASDQGKGVIIVSAHLGNFDFVGQALLARGFNVTIPVERVQPEKLFLYLMKTRGHQGLDAVPIERAPRRMLQALRNGGMVGITCDRNVAGRPARVPFFGRPANLPRSPVWLARHASSPVVVAITIRTGFNRFLGIIRPVDFEFFGNGDHEEEGVRRIANALEPFIRQYPEQWQAFWPVWDDGDQRSEAATMERQSRMAT